MGRLLENVWIYRTNPPANNRALQRRSQKSQEERESKKYRHWRADVLRRDKYHCRECGKEGRHNLEAHHIEAWIHNPRLRFTVSNGLTLCIECHDRTHPWRVFERGKPKRSLKAKPKIFDALKYSQDELKALIPI